MSNQPSVLIVDPCEETREVLRTILERRGVKTVAAAKARQGWKLAQQHRPDLIVLDLELESAAEEFGSAPSMAAKGAVVTTDCGGCDEERTDYEPRLVLLGNLRRLEGLPSTGEFVSKPYHYGLLLRRIEELLESHGNRAGESGLCRRCSLSAEPTRAAATI